MHHQHCTQNKKECFPVAGSPTIYFPGFTGALPVDSAYFEVREDGKLWIKERLSKRQCHIFFSFFRGVRYAMHRGWRRRGSYGWITQLSRMREKKLLA